MSSWKDSCLDGLFPVVVTTKVLPGKTLTPDYARERSVKLLLFRTILVVAPLVLAPQAFGESLTECLTTTASGQIFGKPFPSSDRWYGSESLAVMLPPNGIWRGMGPEHHYRDKLFWWSYGFKPGGESNFKVSARNLSDSSLAAEISIPTGAHAPSLGGWTMLVAVEFPAAGCWEITGDYLGQRLSFVVEVRDHE